MNYIKLALLASLAVVPAMPMIKIGDNNTGSIIMGGNNNNIVMDGIKVRNMDGKLSILDGQITCDNCTALIEFTKGYTKKVVECIKGNCTETIYNTWTGQQTSSQTLLNTPEMAPESPVFGFFAKHPILAPALVGATVLTVGYGLYKLSKMAHKSKKR